MSEKKLAVAFGGGGARGLSHIWIMDALDELGIKPVALSGCSIGALAAICYASGISGKDMHAYVSDLFGNSREVFSRFWQLRPRSFSDLWAGGGQLGQLDPERIAEAFLPSDMMQTFEELTIPTSLSATNYFTGEEVLLNQGSTIKAIAASMAIPTLFRPVEMDGKTLIDGGCVNPMPIDHVRPVADVVVAVDVVGVPLEPEDGKLGAFEMGFGATQILMQTIQREKMRHDRVDILIHPQIGEFRLLDFLKAREILAASEGAKDELKRRLDQVMCA